MPITSIFLALLALILLFHSMRVMLRRREISVGFGTGKDEQLTRRIRIQANAAEYIPVLVLLMWGLESLGAVPWFLWLYGLATVIGRLLHAYGMWDASTPGWGRLAGTALTFTALGVGACYLLYIALVG